MNTKISDAALDAFDRAYCDAWRESTISFPGRTISFHVREANRAAIEDALPHLQPAKPEAVRLRDELRERAEFEAWAQSAEIDVSLSLFNEDSYKQTPAKFAWMAWQAALAATGKQQVGEVPGDTVLGYVRVDAIKALREDDDVTGVMVHVEERTNSVPVYLATPPAQAVDLGQFRECVELMEWQERGHANPDFPVGDPKKHAEALRLLALIDGQAVQS